MGTIKIEFDCPDFKEELNINIVIRKDGEVVRVENNSTFTTPTVSQDIISPEVSTVDKKISGNSKKKESTSTTKKRSGNMMDFELC